MARVALTSLYDKGALGLRHVSGALRAAGHDVSLVYLKEYNVRLRGQVRNLPPEILHRGLSPLGEEIVFGITAPVTPKEEALYLDLLRRLDPDLVGFGLRSCVRETAARMSDRVRAELGRPVIWGGIEPTLNPEGSIAHADYVCRGEGEQPLLELLEHLGAGRDPAAIANLWLRRDGDVVRNELRPLYQDLDQFAYPDYDPAGKYLIDYDRLVEDPAISNTPGAYEIMTARGCPFSCSYCCNDALRRLYPKQKYLRRRSVEHVLGELRTVRPRRPNVYSVSFFDDVFTFDTAWIAEFAPRYREEVGLPFWCYVSPLHINKEALRRLAANGLKSVTCGIESGSERILFDVFTRPIRNTAVVNTAATLRELGIPYNFDIITDNPFENDEDCQQTLDLLLSLPRPVRLNNGLSKLTFFPAAKITEMAGRLETMTPEQSRYDFYNRLYLMAQGPWPAGFVRWLSRRRWLRRHPGLLVIFFLGGRLRRRSVEAAKAVARRVLPRSVFLWLKRKLVKGFASF